MYTTDFRPVEFIKKDLENDASMIESYMFDLQELREEFTRSIDNETLDANRVNSIIENMQDCFKAITDYQKDYNAHNDELEKTYSHIEWMKDRLLECSSMMDFIDDEMETCDTNDMDTLEDIWGQYELESYELSGAIGFLQERR